MLDHNSQETTTTAIATAKSSTKLDLPSMETMDRYMKQLANGTDQSLIEEGGPEMKALIEEGKNLEVDLERGSHLFVDEKGQKILLQTCMKCAAEDQCTLKADAIDNEGDDPYVQCVICSHGAHRKCVVKFMGKNEYACKDCSNQFRLKLVKPDSSLDPDS